jgi:hypothetical protein
VGEGRASEGPTGTRMGFSPASSSLLTVHTQPPTPRLPFIRLLPRVCGGSETRGVNLHGFPESTEDLRGSPGSHSPCQSDRPPA